MASELIDYLDGRKPKGFRSTPYYSKEGDFLTFYFQGDDHYAERIDDILTVYHAMDGDAFVGFKLKGVCHLLETIGDLFLQVHDAEGDLMLSMLLVAGTMRTKEPSSLHYYQEFARQTKNVPIKRKELMPV